MASQPLACIQMYPPRRSTAKSVLAQWRIGATVNTCRPATVATFPLERNSMNRRQLQATHLVLLAVLATCSSPSPALAFDDELPPYTDYCEMLAQEIQGRKHAFLAGNLTYYVGGRYACWRHVEDETIGLTHPFHHDLRGRGFGLAKHPGSGFGHDFRGWEFYNQHQNRLRHGGHWRSGVCAPRADLDACGARTK